MDGSGFDPRLANALRNREIAAAYFDQHATDSFKTVVNIEGMSEERLRAHTARGNVFGAIAMALREGGQDIGTSENGGPLQLTVGDVMNALQATKSQAHGIACYCMSHATGTVTGQHTAYRLRHLSDV